MIDERSIADMAKGGEVSVPSKDVSEPNFRHDGGGDWEAVHAGNREFVKGDKITRPNGGGERGGGGREAGTGKSVDEFNFTLSREEFLNIFFDDLELPHLVRTHLGDMKQKKPVRAGYVRDGAPSNLCVIRTLKTALGRRIALGAPTQECLECARAELEAAIGEELDSERIDALTGEIADLESKLSRMPFLDELDLRFRHRVMAPQPLARAVMFCLMDVSASMDEEKKDLAKRFFTLLYLFLTRKYKEVDLVFIRHTDDAEEVDEDTFFHDPRTGGTIVLSALELAAAIHRERYMDGWNVYAAQASDGDAFGADSARSARYLREKVLPATRYYTYLELNSPHSPERPSALWVEYQVIAAGAANFAMRRASQRDQIYPVFHDLFKKDAQ
jgi:uncharacterized sporulation protein YeaH/YhbH (DUF444 family)